MSGAFLMAFGGIALGIVLVVILNRFDMLP